MKHMNEFVEVMKMRSANGLVTSAAELSNILKAAEIGGIVIFYSYTNMPIGYAIYAMIDRWTLDFIIRSKGPILNQYEWNEGGIVHIVDFLIMRRQKTLCIRRFKYWVKNKRCVSYLAKGRVTILKRYKTDANHIRMKKIYRG